MALKVLNPFKAFSACFRAMWLGVIASLCLMASPCAQAHKASDAYLQARQEGQLIALRWDVSLRDLQALMPLDTNEDGRITWGELKAHRTQIDGYMLSHLTLQSSPLPASVCRLRPVPEQGGQSQQAPLERRSDGTYYVLRLVADCPVTPTQRGQGAAGLQVSYRFMQEVDPTHRGLWQWLGREPGPVALLPDGRPVWLPGPAQNLSMMDAPTLALGALALRASYTPDLQAEAPPVAPAPSAHPWQMVRDGMHHILMGTDHVLFLICLLLPAVLWRESGTAGPRGGTPVPHARQAIMPVLGTITMFTVAHSITLALAALGWVKLSPRWVEPGIALTIALAAIDNLWPIFHGRRQAFTFVFGLVHGFGFAGVLAEMQLPTSGFVSALLQFNVGVELGQLLVVVPALLLLLPLRHWPPYARTLMPAASVLALLVAAGWWVERVFDMGFMPL